MVRGAKEEVMVPEERIGGGGRQSSNKRIQLCETEWRNILAMEVDQL